MSDIFDHYLEAYDRGMNGEWDEVPHGREISPPQDKTCRYCGKTGLRWREFNTKYSKHVWRLVEGKTIDAKVHDCLKVNESKVVHLCWQCDHYKMCKYSNPCQAKQCRDYM